MTWQKYLREYNYRLEMAIIVSWLVGWVIGFVVGIIN